MATRSIAFDIDDVNVYQIHAGVSYWYIMRQAEETSESEFRYALLPAYVNDRLYGLYINHVVSDEDSGHVSESFNYQLPAACIVSESDSRCCEYIWVHPTLRRNGLGRKFIDTLGIRSMCMSSVCDAVLSEASSFWAAVGVQCA